jgi:hypothetical protein
VWDTEAEAMYGYNDYNGPFQNDCMEDIKSLDQQQLRFEEDSEDENDPLRPGLWMEGDSLAPPCGCSIPVIHEMLTLASVTATDILYDLGAGDGRVCLEAYAICRCQYTVGIEIEPILVQRFQQLIQNLGNNTTPSPPVVAYQGDLRHVLTRLVENTKPIHLSDTKNTDTNTPNQLLHPTVITIYLLPEAIREIESLLLELLRRIQSLRILCNTWGIPTLQPYRTKDVDGTKLYLYTYHSLEAVEYST